MCKQKIKKVLDCIHTSSSTYPKLSCGGSPLCKVFQMSFSPATLSSICWRIPTYFQTEMRYIISPLGSGSIPVRCAQKTSRGRHPGGIRTTSTGSFRHVKSTDKEGFRKSQWRFRAQESHPQVTNWGPVLTEAWDILLKSPTLQEK